MRSSEDSIILLVSDDGRVGVGSKGIDSVFHMKGRSGFGNIMSAKGSDGTAHLEHEDNGDLTTMNIFHFSDRRLKRDIAPMQPMLPRVMALEPKRYRMRSDDEALEPEMGFIAQDVEKVFPGLVGQTGDYLALQYDAFGVIAVKAIQEQQAQLDAKNAEIEALNERLARVERLLDAGNQID